MGEPPRTRAVPAAGKPLIAWRRRRAGAPAEAGPQAAALWVIQKPDELVAGSLHALRLAITSGPKMIAAVVLRNSVRKLDDLHRANSMLPEGLLLLVGGLATAFAADTLESFDSDNWAASLRRMAGLAHRLTGGSLQDWLAIAAPALLALWVSLSCATPLLRWAFGREAPAGGRLMLATISAVAVLTGALLSTAAFGEALLNSLSETPDPNSMLEGAVGLLILLALAALLLVPFAGFRFAQQASAHLGARRWLDLVVVGPGMFVLVAAAPMYLYLNAQHWANSSGRWMATTRASEEDNFVTGLRPQCYAVADRVHCQMLLMSTAAYPLVLTAVRHAQLRFKDAKFNQGVKVKFDADVQQLSPSTGSATLWRLDPNVPLPLVVSLPKDRFCEQLALQRADKAGVSKLRDFDLNLLTGPGYQLTTNGDFAYPYVFLASHSQNEFREKFMRNAFLRTLSEMCPA